MTFGLYPTRNQNVIGDSTITIHVIRMPQCTAIANCPHQLIAVSYAPRRLREYDERLLVAGKRPSADGCKPLIPDAVDTDRVLIGDFIRRFGRQLAEDVSPSFHDFPVFSPAEILVSIGREQEPVLVPHQQRLPFRSQDFAAVDQGGAKLRRLRVIAQRVANRTPSRRLPTAS